MGFLDKAFQKLQVGEGKALDEVNKNEKNPGGNRVSFLNSSITSRSSSSSIISMTMADVMHYGSHATRWQKAVMAIDSIVGEVTNFDPDGVDIVCVGGESLDTESHGITWHRNVKDTQGLEDKITAIFPGGPCPLGRALDEVLKEALQKDVAKNPCSVLVLTAGRPDDPDLLEKALSGASQMVADRGGVTACPLSVTFIQIGNDEEASEYLKYLDKKMVGICDETGEKIDIVDTMPFSELDETMNNMKEYEQEKQKGKKGAILGAVAGAAIGVGGMYLYSQQKAKKRMKSGSWGGKWKCLYEGEEIATLTVKDDGKGSLTIDGLQDTMRGRYLDDDQGAAVDSEDFFIQFTEPSGEIVKGSFDATKFVLNWSDGTEWEALNRTNWAGYMGAATAGAAAVGATGYAIDKKFFRKVGDEDQCDYILVVDRSDKMEPTDDNA